MKKINGPCELCVALAACRHKSEIRCNVFHHWYWYDEAYSETIIKECLPNWTFDTPVNKG